MRCRATLSILVAAGCSSSNVDSELRQGGATTVDDRTQGAFLHYAANMPMADQETFQAGTSPFDFHWEIPQLGPAYNNDSCFGCHDSNGRGLSQIGAMGALTDINGPQSQALVRTSLLEGDADPTNPGGPIPVPGFGTQLHDHSTVGVADVVVTLAWNDHDVTYASGETVNLRSPVLTIVAGNSAPLPGGMQQSYRIAPPLIGLGLLAAVDPSAFADPDDTDGDGISGALNQVWDPEQNATVVGRFGWKNNMSTLHLQAAAAGRNDMGLSTSVFPDADGTHDITDDQLAGLTFLVNTIAVPAAAARDATATHGRQLFDDFGCSSCHMATLETGDSPIAEVAHQTIHPYTDLLLHDMGDLLTDARPDFLAQGVEWRTPALWGIGLAQTVSTGATFLHDGRARTFEEAIMWHGGEAQPAHDKFQAAAKADRDALTAFLGTL